MGQFLGLSKDIVKQLSKNLSLNTGKYTQNFLSKLSIQISLYLIEAKHIMLQFQKRLQMYNLYNAFDISEEYRRWLIAKMMISDDIEECLKNGYVIIDQIRTAITGEHIKYFVGKEIGRGQNRKLYEGYLSLEEIMSMSKLEAIWKNTENSVFKLRINATASKLSNSLRPASTFNQSLYNSIKLYAAKSKKTNEGNVFEAYRYMAKRKIKFDEDVFDTIYLNTRKNTASFVMGGDDLDESIKYFGGANPSLVSLSTIISTLTQFVNILSISNIMELKSSLEQMFSKQLDNISPIIENDLEEVVKTTITSLKQIIPQKQYKF